MAGKEILRDPAARGANGENLKHAVSLPRKSRKSKPYSLFAATDVAMARHDVINPCRLWRWVLAAVVGVLPFDHFWSLFFPASTRRSVVAATRSWGCGTSQAWCPMRTPCNASGCTPPRLSSWSTVIDRAPRRNPWRWQQIADQDVRANSSISAMRPHTTLS